jgi:ferredoxin
MATRYAVDEDLCIACSLCVVRAPDNVVCGVRTACAEIVKQPSGAEEETACAEAAEYCPTGGLHALPEDSVAESR